MKNSDLSKEQIIAWAGAINKDSSIAVLTDPKTGNKYGVKSVTEYVAGYFTDLENGEVLIAANQPVVGVRSIKGNQLPEGKFQVLTSIRVLQDTT